MDSIITQLITARCQEIKDFKNNLITNLTHHNNIFCNAQFVQCGKRLDFRQQNVVFVGWEDGKITIMPYKPNVDNIISLPFSGCLMGTFTFYSCNYAVHISTSEDRDKDRRKDWENFCRFYPIMDIKIFQPNKELITRGNYNQVWGIISNVGNYYSAGMGRDDDERCFIIEHAVKTFNDIQGYTNLHRTWQWHNKRIF